MLSACWSSCNAGSAPAASATYSRPSLPSKGGRSPVSCLTSSAVSCVVPHRQFRRRVDLESCFQQKVLLSSRFPRSFVPQLRPGSAELRYHAKAQKLFGGRTGLRVGYSFFSSLEASKGLRCAVVSIQRGGWPLPQALGVLGQLSHRPADRRRRRNATRTTKPGERSIRL